jgi:long-chain acyl-CoA synthetase
MSGNLAALLAEAAARLPTRPALVHDGAHVAYTELERQAAQLAGLLRAQGVEPGDRVGLLLPNVPAFVAAYYGTLRLGAIAVPLNPLLRPPEVRLRLEHAGARVLVADLEPAAEALAFDPAPVWLHPESAGAAEPAGEIVPREGAETAVILYTSGTTGQAKGAELTHDGLRAKAEFLAGPLLRLTADDVLLGAAPLSHVLGQSGIMNPAIVAGACVVMMGRFEAEAALALMRDTGTTVLLAVPTMCIGLLRAAERLRDSPRLRTVHAGGAPLAPETIRELEERFGCEVLEGYGMTETAGVVSAHRTGQAPRPGSVGVPADGMELRLVDAAGADAPQGEIGEVLVRGAGLMKGYWHNPAATEEAMREGGWFATGDMGYLDGDGFLFLVDRKKDVVLRGGYSVYPREIEDVLAAHPAILEAVALGVPDDTLGEEVVAVVVPRPGQRCDPEEVRGFVRERVAAYKYPRAIVIAESLPHSPSGKVLRREIDRAPLREALDQHRSTDRAPR